MEHSDFIAVHRSTSAAASLSQQLCVLGIFVCTTRVEKLAYLMCFDGFYSRCFYRFLWVGSIKSSQVPNLYMPISRARYTYISILSNKQNIGLLSKCFTSKAWVAQQVHIFVALIDLFKSCMELCNIILFTTAGFTLSYARYGKPRNGCDVMQLHARIWKGLSFYASGNVGHYQSTITSHNDPRSWCHERQVCFLLKRQNCTMHTRVSHITLWSSCLDWLKSSRKDR